MGEWLGALGVPGSEGGGSGRLLGQILLRLSEKEGLGMVHGQAAAAQPLSCSQAWFSPSLSPWLFWRVLTAAISLKLTLKSTLILPLLCWPDDQ